MFLYRTNELKLYYLFMMSDGEITSNEKKLYNKICKTLNVEPFEKVDVANECKEINSSDIFSTIKEMIDVGSPSNRGVAALLQGLRVGNEKENATILWNLINLGYADSYFSDEEKRIVEFIKNYWKISDDLYQEMIDVAETCLALENHKDWLNEFEESEYKDEGLKQVKKDIKFVLDSIETTLSELDD